jgi:hypothetical protein
MKRFLRRGTAALAWASTVALLAASPVSAAGPTAAVGGLTDPSQGTLTLEVRASDSDGTLASTAALVDGVLASSAGLCPPDSQTGCQSELARLPVDTTRYVDGVHHLAVTITDGTGAVFTVYERDFEVWNHRPTGSPTATLEIGSGGTAQQEASSHGGSSGGVQGASDSSCRSPKLSMFLAQKPLRVSKGVAVLLEGKRYRFTGRLTCVIRGKRSSAPARTRIDVFNVVRGRTVRKGGATVRANGKITLVLSYRSSRTIEFRFRAVDGTTSKVRIKVRIAQRKKV